MPSSPLALTVRAPGQPLHPGAGAAPAPVGCQYCSGQPRCLLGRQTPGVRAAWTPFLTERSFRKGEQLLRQGDTGASFSIVKVGTTMLLRGAEDGVERPVGLSGSGQTLGTTALLGQPATLSCKALSAGRVCDIAIAPLLDNGLLDRDFLQALAVGYTQNNAALADWARIVRIKGATGQLAGALLHLATLQRSLLVRLPSHTALAALLATTRETIARTLRQLAQQHALVRRDRWHCEIVPAALQALAGAPAALSAYASASAKGARKVSNSAGMSHAGTAREKNQP